MSGARANRATEVQAALATFVVSGALFVGGAAAGWPGEANSCLAGGNCYCEFVRDGWLAQPANTLSALGFVLVGFVLAFHAVRERRRTRGARTGVLFVDDPILAPLYCAVAVFLGPGAMYFHAGMTEWAGVLDASSMYLFIFFLLAYDTARWLGLGGRAALALYAALTLPALLFQVLTSASSVPVFAAAVTAACFLEIAMARHAARTPPGSRRGRCMAVRGSRRWLVFGVACFFLAMAFWIPSHTGGPLCRPHSLFQGHAAWHLLSAVTVGSVYAYFREQVPEEDSQSGS